MLDCGGVSFLMTRGLTKTETQVERVEETRYSRKKERKIKTFSTQTTFLFYWLRYLPESFPIIIQLCAPLKTSEKNSTLHCHLDFSVPSSLPYWQSNLKYCPHIGAETREEEPKVFFMILKDRYVTYDWFRAGARIWLPFASKIVGDGCMYFL